ncbi:MAG: cobalamin biosynthesis protein CobW, partial [Erysipelotrichaceae bacterium]|nr:cobalamin biosynthesis protein CobW [Erysipelotrichaceae bacterium]
MELIVVNGFLGSGKTTLIQRFLQDAQAPLPVIVNEFGKTTYDADLLGRLSDAVTSIHHGSIFCTCKAPEFIDV